MRPGVIAHIDQERFRTIHAWEPQHVLFLGQPQRQPRPQQLSDRGFPVPKRTGGRVLTSITLHLRFIRDRKSKYGTEFAELIRITKWWKRDRPP